MATSVIKGLPKVIESGTDGIWKYRKWSDGTAECWGKRTGTMGAFTAWGSIFSQNIDAVNYPSGLFIEAPIVQADVYSAGLNFVSGTNPDNGAATASKTPNITLVRGTSATGSSYPYVVDYYAIGRWK